jgi:hypothetical protein
VKSGLFLMFSAASVCALAQEATSGFDLRGTLSAGAFASTELTSSPRDGSTPDAGFRAVFYPILKLDEHWAITGTFQAYSRPWFFESFSTQGHGLKGNLLQATLNYSWISPTSSIVVRAGQLSTAFGSFPLRYDDADNPMIDLPMQYGYYYAPVSNLGVAGAQIDLTHGKWDARLQAVNSSAANPRSVFAKDQYLNWAGGAGYTIVQGLRIGLSAYRGPYLYRQFPYFFPGEANPVDLPAHALGLDVQWARGHWYTWGELQSFTFPYRAIPVFREKAGYAEVKRVLNPRWYIGMRGGYLKQGADSESQSIEATAGFRPASHELIKFGFEVKHYSADSRWDRTAAIQLVTTVHPLSFSRR